MILWQNVQVAVMMSHPLSFRFFEVYAFTTVISSFSQTKYIRYLEPEHYTATLKTQRCLSFLIVQQTGSNK